MMRKTKFYRRWNRRFFTGLAGTHKSVLECLRTSDPLVVHDLRVGLRRARLLALVGRPMLGKTRVAQFRQWAMKLATALSGVRDYDVMLDWLKAHSPGAQQDQLLREKRARTWRLARPKLMALSRREWKEIRIRGSSPLRAGGLRDNFRKECSKTGAALARDAARFHKLDAAGLHEFRRTLRRQRYLRELALGRREQKVDRELKRLIAFQEALGEMRNCYLVRTFFSSQKPPATRLIKLAKSHEGKWLRRANRHLGGFLRDAK